MKVSTILDSIIASLILFVGSLVALFQENPELTFESINQSTWVVMGGMAVLSFLKAYQTLSARRLLDKVTKESE